MTCNNCALDDVSHHHIHFPFTELPEHLKKAESSLKSSGVLNDNAIKEYVRYLQIKPPFILAERFIQKGQMNERDARKYILQQMNLAKNENKLLFVPIVLEKDSRNKVDHVAMLFYNPDTPISIKDNSLNRSWEYYGPQGKNALDEERQIKGIGGTFGAIFGSRNQFDPVRPKQQPQKIRQVVSVKKGSDSFFDFISSIFEFFLSLFGFSAPLR